MVIVMEQDGDGGAGPEGHRDAGGGGLRRAPLHRRQPHRAGRGGRAARAGRPAALELIPGVREVVKISEPYKLVGRTFKAADTVVDVAGVKVGGPEVIVMAGPCSVETREQVRRWPRARCGLGGARAARRRLQAAHLALLVPGPRRGGAALDARGRATSCGLAVVSEVMDLRTIEMMLRYVDCLQVGARNMQNFDLLQGAGPRAQARAAQARPVAPPSRSGCSPPSTSWPAATRR